MVSLEQRRRALRRQLALRRLRRGDPRLLLRRRAGGLAAGSRAAARGWPSGARACTSEITGESERVVFGVLHLGDHNLSGRGRPVHERESEYERLVEEISGALPRGGPDGDRCARSTVASAGACTRCACSSATSSGRSSGRILQLGPRRQPTPSTGGCTRSTRRSCGFSRATASRQPRGFAMAAELALNTSLRQALEAAAPDIARLRGDPRGGRNVRASRCTRTGSDWRSSTGGRASRRELARRPEDVDARWRSSRPSSTLGQVAALRSGFLEGRRTRTTQLARTLLPAMTARGRGGFEDARRSGSSASSRSARSFGQGGGPAPTTPRHALSHGLSGRGLLHSGSS